MHIALFKDVKNAAYLRRQLLEANAAFDYAFLDAQMVRLICSDPCINYCFLFFMVHLYKFELVADHVRARRLDGAGSAVS